MATITKGKTFVSGEVVTPTKLHDMVDLATVAGIVDADISATAGIAAPKLASVLDLSAKTVTLPDNVVTTAKIADSTSTITGVTNTKIRQSAALSVIGNSTNATAAPADIAAATDGHVLRRSGTAIGFGTIVNSATTAASANTASAIVARDASGNFTAGTVTASLTGNVTGNVTGNLTGTASAVADSAVTTAKIADSSSTTTGVTNAKIRQSAALSVIGNSTNATAAPADIAAATDGHVLRRSGTGIGFGTIANTATTATSANTASAIVARDASGNFTAGTITAALTGNVTGNLTGTASAVAAGMSISYPTLTGVREAAVTLATTGTVTINPQAGNIFQIKPTANVTLSVTTANLPDAGTFFGMLIRHEGGGTAYTYTWPGTTKWAYGETPTMTSTSNKYDIVSLFTYDKGVTWFGQLLGQNY